MICQKLNYSSVRTYSQYFDWDLVAQQDPDPLGAVSYDSVSDVAVHGLLNWQAEGMLQRLQCCVIRRNDGFSRQVKYHISRTDKRCGWPRYYNFFESVTIRIGTNHSYYVYGSLKAHLDIIGFCMFTFCPHERCASSGISKWVFNDLRLQAMGINEVICSVNRLLSIMGNLAFVYPMFLVDFGSGKSDACSYAEMLMLAHSR